jgi:aminoglycoside 3-N-acetyltransferase I
MDFNVIKLSPDDVAPAKQLILFFQEDDGVAEPLVTSDAYLQKLLAKESFHIVVAMKDGFLIGGATAYELDMYKKSVREMFLYEIAVKPAYRQTGVGAALIGKLKQLCSQRGIDEMYVGTTTPNLAAMKLYSSTGGELVADIAWFVYQLENK